MVKQIGYLYQNSDGYMFEMMGDEFSANGCRAAGFLMLKFRPGIIKFRTTGTSKLIYVNLDKNGTTTLSLPYQFTERKMIKTNLFFLIKMFGSYLLVVEQKSSRKFVQKLIKKNFRSVSAVGIMFTKLIAKNKIKLNPFFYVRKTNTLINETACGSGSTVAALFLSYTNKKSFKKLEVQQPSGESIFINTDYNKGIINEIGISGPTKFLGNYKVET